MLRRRPHERKGIATGAIHDGKLHLVFYHGARIHYFAKNLAEVEGSSVRRG